MPAVSCNVVSRTQELLLASRTTLPCAAEFLTPLLVQLPAKSLSSGQQCVLTTSMSASCAANELNCCLVFCFLLSAFRYVLLFMQAKHKFSKVLVCGKLIFFCCVLFVSVKEPSCLCCICFYYVLCAAQTAMKRPRGASAQSSSKKTGVN